MQVRQVDYTDPRFLLAPRGHLLQGCLGKLTSESPVSQTSVLPNSHLRPGMIFQRKFQRNPKTLSGKIMLS